MCERRRLFWIVLMILFFLVSKAYAMEKIRIATLNWEPYIGQTITNEGFMAEVTREIFKRVGYKVEYIYLPWKRAVKMAEQGKFDGYFPAYWSKQREEKSIFTNSIISGPVVFFKIKGSDISFKKLEALKPYRIGVVHGFVNTTEFDKADYLNKEKVTTNLQNIKKLFAGRIDLIVIDKYVGLYVFDFGDQVAVGYTADEIAVLLESEKYADGKVYRIHRALPDGTMELQGVPREKFHCEDGLFFYRADDGQARQDLETFLAHLIPDGDPMFIHRDEGPDDMPAHLRTILTHSDLTIPVRNGVCALGTWQGIFVCEHRTHGHQRRLVVTVQGD